MSRESNFDYTDKKFIMFYLSHKEYYYLESDRQIEAFKELMKVIYLDNNLDLSISKNLRKNDSNLNWYKENGIEGEKTE